MKYQNHWDELFRKRFGEFLTIHRADLQEASFEDFPPFNETPAHERSSPFQAGPGIGFLREGEALELPLEALRRLPRYLLAMTLMTDVNVVDSSHYEYWRVTGAAASLYGGMMESRKNSLDRFEQSGEQSRAELIESFGYTMRQPLEFSELYDLMILIQIGLLGERQTGSPPLDVDRTFYKITNYCFQIATRYGFPLLESLANNLGDGNHNKFLPRMESWFEGTPNALTRKTLLEFDRMWTVDPEYILPDRDIDEIKDIEGALGVTEESLNEYISRFEELTTPEEIDSPEGRIDTKDGLLRELKEHRNPSQHGYGQNWHDWEQGIYRVPAVTIITLCSLAFWDGITKDQFENIRQRLGLTGKSYSDHLEEIRLMSWQPEDFYSRSTLSDFSIYEE